jgi:MFS family permease
MPESDLWEQASVEHGTKAGVGLGEIRELFGSRLRRPMLLALILTIINMASYWLPYSWLPAYLQRERNLTVAQSGWWMLVSVAGQLVGYGSFGFVSDRLGRRPSFSLYAIIMAAGLLGITVLWDALAGSSALLLAALFVVGVGTGTWSNFGPLFTELFPTRLRTTATSGIFNLARGTQFFVPLLVASMADRYGLAGGIGLGAGCALLAALWVWTLPETRGKVLTD